MQLLVLVVVLLRLLPVVNRLSSERRLSAVYLASTRRSGWHDTRAGLRSDPRAAIRMDPARPRRRRGAPRSVAGTRTYTGTRISTHAHVREHTVEP